MAFVGLAAFFAAMGFAGVAVVPLFNPFRLPENRWSPMGCWWILAALFLLWVAAWCFFHVPSIDSQTGQPYVEPESMNYSEGG